MQTSLLQRAIPLVLVGLINRELTYNEASGYHECIFCDLHADLAQPEATSHDTHCAVHLAWNWLKDAKEV